MTRQLGSKGPDLEKLLIAGSTKSRPIEGYSSDGNYINPQGKEDKTRIVTVKKEIEDNKDQDGEDDEQNRERKRRREKLPSPPTMCVITVIPAWRGYEGQREFDIEISPRGSRVRRLTRLLAEMFPTLRLEVDIIVHRRQHRTVENIFVHRQHSSADDRNPHRTAERLCSDHILRPGDRVVVTERTQWSVDVPSSWLDNPGGPDDDDDGNDDHSGKPKSKVQR